MKKREQGRAQGSAAAGVDFMEKARFERLERAEGVNYMDVQGKKLPVRDHSKY